MSPVHVDSSVRLEADLPSAGLRRGDEGVVTSVWLSPDGLLCEVQFRAHGERQAVRRLLRAELLRNAAP